MRYRLYTLGRLSLHQSGSDQGPVLSDSKSLAVLAYVAAVPGHEVERSHLADLLWPGSDRKRARRSLRQAIYYLSQKAEDGLLLSDNGRVAANPRKLELDLWEFEEALEEERWERAVDLYGGPFLGGYSVEGAREFEGWVESRNERIWSGLKAAYYRIVQAAVDEGEPERAVRFGQEYVDLNPLDETAQRTLVRAHLAAGDRVGAFRAYQEYRALLREELDEEPGDELQRRIADLQGELFGSPMAPPPEPPSLAPGEIGRRLADSESVDSGATVDIGDRAAGGGRGKRATADGPGPGPGGERSRVISWLAAGLAAGLALGIGTHAALTGPGASGEVDGRSAGVPSHTWSKASGRLRIQTQGRGWFGVSVSRGELREVRRQGVQPVLWSPEGRRKLVMRDTPGGLDVAVVERSGDTSRVIGSGADEEALAWAPDGRRAAIWRGERTDGGRDLKRRLAVVDLESGAERTLDSLELVRPPAAAWSPRGTSIAFRAVDREGRTDLFLADADLSRVRRLTASEAKEGEPDWSPDGERLAFSVASGEDRDLRVMSPGGSGPEPVTFGASDDRLPVWLSPHHLAFLSDREGGDDVWLLDLQTREVRRLTDRGDVRRLALDARGRDMNPVDSVRIAGVGDTVCPGQRLSPSLEVYTADDAPAPDRSVSVRWTTSDTGIVRVSPDGELTVQGAGRAALVASAGGWRADTLRLASVPLGLRDAEGPLFSEDWEGGIAPVRWASFGEPRPILVDVPAAPVRTGASLGTTILPDRAFVNNGDANYGSGVVGRDRFSTAGGLTLEFQAALPFTQSIWQGLRVGLVRRLPDPNGGPYRVSSHPTVLLNLGGETRSEGSVTVNGRQFRFAFPADDSGNWHRYALQLEPDGRVSVVVDDVLWWRSARPVAEGLLAEEMRPYLGGRSHETRLMVGRVRLWRGVRFGPRSPGRRVAAGTR